MEIKQTNSILYLSSDAPISRLPETAPPPAATLSAPPFKPCFRQYTPSIILLSGSINVLNIVFSFYFTETESRHATKGFHERKPVEGNHS